MSDGMTCATGITEPCRLTDTAAIGATTTLRARRFRPKVLFVDDEPHVVNGIRRAFLRYPYKVHTATSAELALEMFRWESFDVIVADEQMPGMQGSELLTIVAREFPTCGRILLTGHATVEAAARAINDAGVIRFLLKPCPPEELRSAIETALRTTPFEKSARASGRRIFLVAHRNRLDAEARATERPSSAHRRRAEEMEAAHSGASRHGAAGKPHADSEASELVLQAQKVVALDQARLFGYELSARLRTQAGGTHTVGNFISSADNDVPLPSVDRWVARNVLAVLREHGRMLERRDLRISLNIAGQSLADAQFMQFLDRELSRSGIAARFLIEIRESALIKGLRGDDGMLRRFFEMDCFKWGCRLCIDGVGQDIGQLASLESLPVAVAKLDSRYVCDILTNRQSELSVNAVVEWGQRTGIEIAATGVDTIAIAERLRAAGVQYGQGTAFGALEPLNLIFGRI